MTIDMLLTRPVKIGIINVISSFLYSQIPVNIKVQIWKIAPSYWELIDAFVIGFISCLIAGVLGAYGEPYMVKLI